MRVDIWSEVTCPWCGLGRHRLQRAVERFEVVAWGRFGPYSF